MTDSGKKPIILFDIDRTIFDTDRFHILYSEEFIPILKTSTGELEAVRKAYSTGLTVSTDFLPASFLKHIAEHYSVSYLQLRKKYYQAKNFRGALYPDVIPCLSVLKLNYSLGIFSEGFASFQKTKLKKSGVVDFFTPELTHVHRRKNQPSVFKKLPISTIIVDDKPEIIEAVDRFPRLIGILLDRHHRFSAPRLINSLNQLPALLRQLSAGD